MARIFAPGTHAWEGSRAPIDLLTPQDIQRAYEDGWAGAYRDPEEHEALLSENQALTGYGTIDDAATANGWAESGKGKLIVPYIMVEEAYPGCQPGPAQEGGDCVSHSAKNAALGSMVAEVVAGEPDEVSGLTEGLPEVSPTGVKQGVLSTEAVYWWRRSSGHGWYCSAAARVMQKESGCWLRKDYPELGFDLTRYSGRMSERWGRTPPTGNVAQAGKLHLCRAFAQARTAGAQRDALANGYFLSTCGMEGFSNSRDSYGVSTRRGQWAHAMAYIGWDDRAVVVRKYGGPLALVLNSWGVWNTGNREIFDSAQYVPTDKKQRWIELGLVSRATGNLLIPQGSFWARFADVSRREVLAVSSVNGWPRKRLENYGGSLAG